MTVCAFCSTPFEPSRSDAKYCPGGRCRKAAHDARHARREESEVLALGRIARHAVRNGELDFLGALEAVTRVISMRTSSRPNVMERAA